MELINISNGRSIVLIAWPEAPAAHIERHMFTHTITEKRSRSTAAITKIASQPSNWEIHLNSLKWHFSDTSLSHTRLWIKVISHLTVCRCVCVGGGARVCVFALLGTNKEGISEQQYYYYFCWCYYLVVIKKDWQPAPENDSQTNLLRLVLTNYAQSSFHCSFSLKRRVLFWSRSLLACLQ